MDGIEQDSFILKELVSLTSVLDYQTIKLWIINCQSSLCVFACTYLSSGWCVCGLVYLLWVQVYLANQLCLMNHKTQVRQQDYLAQCHDILVRILFLSQHHRTCWKLLLNEPVRFV